MIARARKMMGMPASQNWGVTFSAARIADTYRLKYFLHRTLGERYLG